MTPQRLYAESSASGSSLGGSCRPRGCLCPHWIVDHIAASSTSCVRAPRSVRSRYAPGSALPTPVAPVSSLSACTAHTRPAGAPHARPPGHSGPRARAFPDSSRCCCCRTLRPARPPPSRPPSRLSSPSGARIRGPVVSVAAHGGAGPRRCRRHGLRAPLPRVGAGRRSALIPAPRFLVGPARTPATSTHPATQVERPREAVHPSLHARPERAERAPAPSPAGAGAHGWATSAFRAAHNQQAYGARPLVPGSLSACASYRLQASQLQTGCSASGGTAANAQPRAPPLGSATLARHAVPALQVHPPHVAPQREVFQPYCPGSELTASPSTIPPPQRPAVDQPRPAPASR